LQFLQDFFDELEQVVDLLELAPRVLVELALAREDVQFLEQLDRLADFWGQGGCRKSGKASGATSKVVSRTSGSMAARSRSSRSRSSRRAGPSVAALTA
jgi:hypothetical protein